MDKEIKKKWIDALRSGEYKQGRHTLINNNGEYCCLGVLCEVTNSKKWRSREYLPEHIVKKTGISTATGRLKRPVRGEICLSKLNDRAGFTFAQIADVIEEQF